jgi:hypothetical protein
MLRKIGRNDLGAVGDDSGEVAEERRAHLAGSISLAVMLL